MSRKILNASEIGKIGGQTTVEKHGADHMLEIGMKGNETMRKLGKDFLRQRALKAAESRKKNREAKRNSLEVLGDLLQGK